MVGGDPGLADVPGAVLRGSGVGEGGVAGAQELRAGPPPLTTGASGQGRHV